MPFLAEYVYRKVLLLMVKRFTICNGFIIDRKIITLTSFYNDRNTKNNRVYGHPAKFCVGKQKSHFLRFLRKISHFCSLIGYGGVGVNQGIKRAGSIGEVVARQPFYLWGMFICNNGSDCLSD